MITYDDAKYIIAEIRRISYYQKRISLFQEELDEITNQMLMIGEPKSPNGKDDIGGAKGNEVPDKTRVYNTLITGKMEIEKKQAEFIRRRYAAECYKALLLASEYAVYVQDFLQTKDRWKLSKKYNVANPYDRMIRIVRNCIEKV